MPAIAPCFETTTQLNVPGMELAGLTGVHAMTDVTGFGLLGHLLEMCRGSGLAARITAAQLPLLPGVLALARSGIATGASDPQLAVLWGRGAACAAYRCAAAGRAHRSSDIGRIAGRVRPGRIGGSAVDLRAAGLFARGDGWSNECRRSAGAC